MVSLLNKLEAEETTPKGDRDILHHAAELRKLLSNRAEKSTQTSAKRKAALDQKWPKQSENVNVPAYILQQLKKAKDLPPLPPITEPHLEEAVFTHVSVHTHSRVKGSDNSNDITYERLEFLGDAYIELIATRLIYSRLPHIDVPQQAHLREQLVRNETLGQFSMAYSLPDRLKHGAHMQETKAWNKVVADVFEAYVAGVVLSDSENGFETAEKWLTKLWAPQMLDFEPKVIENPLAKEDIARLIQGRDVSLDYREQRDMIYDNGVQKYYVGVYLTGWGYENELLGSGEGRSKAQASVYAAMNAIKENNLAMRTATEKKQEMVQQRQALKEAKTREIEEAKASEAQGKVSPPVDNATSQTDENQIRSDKAVKAELSKQGKDTNKETLVKDPVQWLEELSKTGKGSSEKDHASWMEKEMRKKEKKERREKKENKRKGAENNS